MIQYTISDLIVYLFLYSFIGWTAEVIWSIAKHHQFINKGFLNLPFSLPYGISAIILMQALPTLHQNLFFKALLSFIVFHIVWSLAEFFVQRICKMKEVDTSNIPTLTMQTQLLFELIASMCTLILLLIVHPFLHGIVRIIPDVVMNLLAIVLFVLAFADFISVIVSLNTKKIQNSAILRKEETQNLAEKLSHSVWKRLNKAYPGIAESPEHQENYTFAKGLCFDKCIWIFLISSFLGALIEMCYCRAAGDIWMNRSSLLYGSFSVVWGVGAVVLTITLKPIAKKGNLSLFLAGFLIGGTYEYLCSVFTELVFGTVFWDYSHMSLNIGGRTNVVYCIFWGILAVVWVKFLYPPMENAIEKLPPLQGKIITWALVVILALDGILTCGAMIRYTQRQTETHPANAVENFFDVNYDDEWMEHRWPNMKITAN